MEIFFSPSLIKKNLEFGRKNRWKNHSTVTLSQYKNNKLLFGYYGNYSLVDPIGCAAAVVSTVFFESIRQDRIDSVSYWQSKLFFH